MTSEIWNLVVGALQGLTVSAVFVLVLFIGFCVAVGMTKLKPTVGRKSRVIRSLDERITGRPQTYLRPDAPRGPADQLRAPELMQRA